MVPIGNRPILWHVMKYYAHFGHTDFILCLGYQADVIKDYFLNYNEAMSNDFVLSDGGRQRRAARHDIDDWRITFVDTGMHAQIGERLMARPEAPRGRGVVPRELRRRASRTLRSPTHRPPRRASDKIASFLCVSPSYSFHLVVLTTRPFVASAVDRCEVGHVDQRRLLRLPPRDLRLHRTGRGPRRGALPAADRGGSSSRTGTRASGRRWTP